MTSQDERYSFPPLGASTRPGDIRRGHRAVGESLAHLVSDTESYFPVLQAALEDFTEEERAGAHGRAVDATLGQTWVMLGVLRGALSLFPREILVRPEADRGYMRLGDTAEPGVRVESGEIEGQGWQKGRPAEISAGRPLRVPRGPLAKWII